MTPTTPENTKRINAFYNSIETTMTNLYGRWLDEKEHEDIKDYAKPIKLPVGFKLIKMTKRPFGFHFSIGTDAVYAITVSGPQYSWKRVK